MHIIQLGWLKGVPIPVKGYGGIERVHHTLSRELARQGHQVTVIAPPSSTVKGCEVIECNDFVEATNIIATLKADIVHDHSCWSLESPIRQGLKIPFISTTHVNDAIGWSKNVVYLSKAQRNKHATQLGRDLSNSPVVFVPIDPDLYPVGLKKENYLLFLGSVAPHKGVLQAAQVAALLDRELVIAGPIADKEYSLRVADVLRKGKFIGEVSDPYRRQLIEQAWAMMCLHQGVNGWVESGCGVVGEAIIHNTPVAATSNGCLKEMVIGGENGWRCDSHSDMAAAMEGPYPTNFAPFQEAWSAQNIVRQYVALYESILSGKTWG